MMPVRWWLWTSRGCVHSVDKDYSNAMVKRISYPGQRGGVKRIRFHKQQPEENCHWSAPNAGFTNQNASTSFCES